jgi:hypothetical protein
MFKEREGARSHRLPERAELSDARLRSYVVNCLTSFLALLVRASAVDVPLNAISIQTLQRRRSAALHAVLFWPLSKATMRLTRVTLTNAV